MTSPIPRNLLPFAGLVPKQRSSGSTTRYGSITHQGSSHLRTALVECAMRIHPKSAPELYAFVERLKPTTGAKKARVALARKLLCIMWSMVVHNHAYDSLHHTLPPCVCNTTMSNLDTGTGT